MGMFDYIKCEHPLPDGFDDQKQEWQTKDLACELAIFTITADGRLVRTGGVYGIAINCDDHHGDIHFYGGNWCGSGFGCVMTRDDMPHWSRLYTARFSEGKLLRITGGMESDDDGLRHLPQADFHCVTRELQRRVDLLIGEGVDWKARGEAVRKVADEYFANRI